MINSIIQIVIGFILWKYMPGKITAGSRKVRSYIDMIFQIFGLLLMILGMIRIVYKLISFISF